MAHILWTSELRAALATNKAEAWQEMHALIKRCAQVGCFRAGAVHLVDDVVSEVLVLMHQSFIHRLREGSPLQPFLTEACRRVALSMRRQLDEYIHIDVTGNNDDDDDTPEPFEAQIPATDEVVVDAQRAKERIKKATSPDFWRKNITTKYDRQQYRCGDERFAQALKAERQRRGWTQKQMAAAMGLKLPTYISYEHACVITPNPDVIDALKAMQAESLDWTQKKPTHKGRS